DSPRIVIISSRVHLQANPDDTTVQLSVDLRNDHVRALAAPGQNVAAVRDFNLLRGVQDSVIESNLFTGPNVPQGTAAVSTAAVFQAAALQGIPFRGFNASNLSGLDAL